MLVGGSVGWAWVGWVAVNVCCLCPSVPECVGVLHGEGVWVGLGWDEGMRS